MPPSSSVTRFRIRRQAHDLAARLRRPRERDLVDAGVLDEVGARRRTVAGHDIQRTGREADLPCELCEPDRRQRGLRIGLQHDGAARRERRSELPRRHHERVVPGDDLGRDADWLFQRVEEERATDRVGAPGDGRDRGAVEAEVLDGLVELGLDGCDRLADVARLELRELGTIRLDRVGERVQEPRALGSGVLPSRPRRQSAQPRQRDRRPPRPPSRRARANLPSPARRDREPRPPRARSTLRR